jgi:acyl carrier protein
MTRKDILDRLRDNVAASTAADVDWNLVTTETAIGELGFDSLSILDLVYDLQQCFGIEFEAEDLVEIDTVGDLVEFIEEELQA